MNIFNASVLKSLLKYCFQQYHLLGNVITYLPDNWRDNEGNNLFHYAALHHDLFLFENAIVNKADINQKNNKGIMPIHRFIECGFIEPENEQQIRSDIKSTFVQLKNNIKQKLKPNSNNTVNVMAQMGMNPPVKQKISFRVLDFNIPLLNKFIEYKADINAFMSNSVTDRITLHQTHNIKNHKGSAIELLIQLFYSNVLYENFHDEKILTQYYEVYKILANGGANINLLEDEKNMGNDSQLDAMQITSKFIVSNYFISYLKYNSQFYTILPILADPNLDFSLKDSQQNTVLHNLFGRIYARHSSLEYTMIELIFKTIVENPSFDKKFLEIENSFRLKPIKILKKESAPYGELFEKFLLYNKLQEIIPQKKTEVRRNKI